MVQFLEKVIKYREIYNTINTVRKQIKIRNQVAQNNSGNKTHCILVGGST